MARQRTLLGWMLAAVAVLSLGQLLSLGDFQTAETAAVALYTGRTAWTSGVVIRREVPVTADPSVDWVPALRDGQQAAAGQVLLRTETDPETAVLARRVRLLRTGVQAAERPLPERRTALHAAIARLNAVPGADRAEAGEALAGLLLGETAEAAASLTEAEEALLARTPARSRTVTAPEAGVFAAAADGLEEILTPEDPWAVWPLPRTPLPRETAGRLITGGVWYFRTELPFETAEGDTLTGYLPWRQEPLRLTVEQTRSGGAVLVSCGQMLDQVAAVRQIQMKMLENCETGLEIPTAGVYTVEDKTGVWVQSGQAARFQPVTVRQTLADTVVLELPEDGGLRPGDQILLDAQ